MYNNVARFVSNQTSNISFMPNVYEAEDEFFASLVKGKVKIRIYNFKEGKGNKAVEVAARIDIESLPYLYELARTRSSERFYEQKIFGYPMESGPYAGLCQMTILSIKRSDKGLWGIAIENGYGKKIQTKTGGYMSAKDSYKKDKSAFFPMSDKDFLSAIYNCLKYIEAYRIRLAVKTDYLDSHIKNMKNERENYWSDNQPAEKEENVSVPSQTEKAYNTKVILRSNPKKRGDGSIYCNAETKEGRKIEINFTELPKGLKKDVELLAPIVVRDKKYFWLTA